MHEKKKKKWVYQRNEIKVFYFTINPVSQARRQKKKKPEKNPQKTETKTRKKRVYQRKKVRVFYFTINPVSQARRQKRTKKTNKKQKLKQEKTGPPTKESKSLLLHYQPSFPGEKA